MKLRLLTKNIIYNTIISIVVLFIGELAVFMFLKREIRMETEEHLYVESRAVIHKLKEGVDINYLRHNIGDQLSFEPVDKITYRKPVIIDMQLEEPEEEENHPGHREEMFTSQKIIFDVPYKDQFYRFTIEKTIDEEEGLEANTILIILVSGLCMLILLFVVNYIIYRRLFRPFYRTLEELKKFNVKDSEAPDFKESGTHEFNELNKALAFTTKKSMEDYQVLKEYVENVSHELQTPLTIINSGIELCLQEGELNEKQLQYMGTALNGLERLSLINQSLVMLTKLDNNLYENSEQLNIAEILLGRLSYFKDFITNKELHTEISKKAEFYCDINKALCKILFDNLIKNAIKYNIQRGIIRIEITDNKISIANTGNPPEKDPNIYFGRFQKSQNSDSLGLGLAICKKICDLYKLRIEYTYSEGLHKILILKDNTKI